MKRRVLKSLMMGLVVGIVLTGGMLSNTHAEAKQKKVTYITGNQFVSYVAKKTGIKKEAINEGTYGKVADGKKKITQEDAAVILNWCDLQLNGGTYSTKKYDAVVSKSRIKDRKKINPTKKEDMYQCFVKGILVGKKNGNYTHTRSLEPKKKVTTSQRKTYVSRLVNKGKRIKITDDGQVTRRTNLPKNYKCYSYILDSFPNKYYEWNFSFQNPKYSRPQKNLEDFAWPKDVRKYHTGFGLVGTALDIDGDTYMDRILKNVRTRLSYNYKKTSTKKFVSDIVSTSNEYNWGSDWLSKFEKELRAYVKRAKKNHVQLTCKQVSTDISSAYFDGGLIFRVAATFKVKADKVPSAVYHQPNDQTSILSGDDPFITGLKKNKYVTKFFDVRLSGDQAPETWRVVDSAEYSGDVLCEQIEKKQVKKGLNWKCELMDN
ncbi:MAG: hypothetical protein K6G65_00975 [Lachnospiraceae bacterium]|nr:hypothetical protein [Lachnospiraceae bacterium]